jgi:hypothetical protein
VSITGVDSSTAPTREQARAGFAAGHRLWGGYLVTATDDEVLAARANERGLFNLLGPWTTAEFAVVRAAGLRALAYCSGLDDPAGLAAKARDLGLVALLDDETAIRPDGPWADAWLQTSGFGLYGLLGIQDQHAAPYRIAALYPGTPQTATWPVGAPVPAVPHGWQWQGTHIDPATGATVDSLALDDWFAPGPLPSGGGSCRSMSAFAFNGTDHVFELSTAGDVWWSRTSGGAGGQVHGNFVNLGGSGPGPVIEHEEWVSSSGAIVVRAKYATGMVMEAWLQPDAEWPQPVQWFAPDQAGPFGLQGLPGPPGPQGPRGPNLDLELRTALHNLPT